MTSLQNKKLFGRGMSQWTVKELQNWHYRPNEKRNERSEYFGQVEYRSIDMLWVDFSVKLIFKRYLLTIFNFGCLRVTKLRMLITTVTFNIQIKQYIDSKYRETLNNENGNSFSIKTLSWKTVFIINFIVSILFCIQFNNF